MHASEGAEQLHGSSEQVRRALDKVAAAEAALAQARRELQAAQRSQYGWTDGLAGRRLVAEALTTLAPSGWAFLDAVHWPGRPGVCIDHVGVGPGGIVVMFSRQWTGAVEVRGGVLRQNGIPRLRETAAVAAAAGAVSALLDPVFRTAVSAFVCTAQHDVRPATVAPGVNVVGLRDVGHALAALPQRLSAGQVAHVAKTLRAALVGTQAPDQLTTRALAVYGEGPALPWLPWSTRAGDGLFGGGPAAGPAAPPGERHSAPSGTESSGPVAGEPFPAGTFSSGPVSSGPVSSGPVSSGRVWGEPLLADSVFSLPLPPGSSAGAARGADDLREDDLRVVDPRVDGRRVDGLRVDGLSAEEDVQVVDVRVDGVRSDGVRSDGVRSDGVRSDRVRSDRVRDDDPVEGYRVDAVAGTAGHGRHRAPARRSSRTAHRAVRAAGLTTPLSPGRLVITTVGGSGLLGLAAWLAVVVL
jgi:hypothetical protein